MSAYSALYARRGYRQATGELAPDWDAPRNWDAPYWKDRADAACIQAGELLRGLVERSLADALLSEFWAAFPDAWMEAQPWRYLALSAEALRNYLLRWPADAHRALADAEAARRLLHVLAGSGEAYRLPTTPDTAAAPS